MTPKLKWTVEAEAPSPLEPDGPLYRVRWAEVANTSNAAVRSALVAVGEEAARLAPANLDRSRSIVLFQWDADPAAVTVVFTDAKRNDAPDVLKLFCTGWERQHRKDPAEWLNGVGGFDRQDAVRAWVDALSVALRPRLQKLFSRRRIRFAFKCKSWARMEAIGSGRFKDPYARG